MYKNKIAKNLLILIFFIVITLGDYLLHGLNNKEFSNYKKFGNFYVYTNYYGIYINYPGSTNFYNVYPVDIFSNPKYSSKDTPWVYGINEVLSYFNISEIYKNSIRFTIENNLGKITSENLPENGWVSITYNNSDILLNNSLEVIQLNNYSIQDLNIYLKSKYNVQVTTPMLIVSTTQPGVFGTPTTLIQTPQPIELSEVVENPQYDHIYIYNPKDNTVIGIQNISNIQEIKRIDSRSNTIWIEPKLGKKTIAIEALNSIKDIR